MDKFCHLHQHLYRGRKCPSCANEKPFKHEPNLTHELEREMNEAQEKAIKALAGYKFQMFGYWAAIWVHLNRISGAKKPNPFAGLVNASRKIQSLADGLQEARDADFKAKFPRHHDCRSAVIPRTEEQAEGKA